MSRRTRIVCTDIDTGESEEVEIGAHQFLVICGADRYVAFENIHSNGTNVVTIKTHKEEDE